MPENGDTRGIDAALHERIPNGASPREREWHEHLDVLGLRGESIIGEQVCRVTLNAISRRVVAVN